MNERRQSRGIVAEDEHALLKWVACEEHGRNFKCVSYLYKRVGPFDDLPFSMMCPFNDLSVQWSVRKSVYPSVHYKSLEASHGMFESILKGVPYFFLDEGLSVQLSFTFSSMVCQ